MLTVCCVKASRAKQPWRDTAGAEAKTQCGGRPRRRSAQAQAAALAGAAARARGAPVPLAVRELLALRLLTTRDSYSVLARTFGVSRASVCRGVAQRVARHFFARAQLPHRASHVDADDVPLRRTLTRVAIRDAVRARPRRGGALRRKVRARERRVVRRALRRANDLTLGELCDLLHAETGTRIAVSTMCALVNRELRLTRKRKARGLPRQALTARNVAWRRHFVARWFGRSADRRKVATATSTPTSAIGVCSSTAIVRVQLRASATAAATCATRSRPAPRTWRRSTARKRCWTVCGRRCRERVATARSTSDLLPSADPVNAPLVYQLPITSPAYFGGNVLMFDAGLRPAFALGDYVWRELDADGVQDAGEPAISGVRVLLFANDSAAAIDAVRAQDRNADRCIGSLRV